MYKPEPFGFVFFFFCFGTHQSPHKCPVCSRAFNQRSNLKTHLLTHTDLKPYECTNCGKVFRRNCDLRRHTLTHTIAGGGAGGGGADATGPPGITVPGGRDHSTKGFDEDEDDENDDDDDEEEEEEDEDEDEDDDVDDQEDDEQGHTQVIHDDEEEDYEQEREDEDHELCGGLRRQRHRHRGGRVGRQSRDGEVVAGRGQAEDHDVASDQYQVLKSGSRSSECDKNNYQYHHVTTSHHLDDEPHVDADDEQDVSEITTSTTTTTTTKVKRKVKTITTSRFFGVPDHGCSDHTIGRSQLARSDSPTSSCSSSEDLVDVVSLDNNAHQQQVNLLKHLSPVAAATAAAAAAAAAASPSPPGPPASSRVPRSKGLPSGVRSSTPQVTGTPGSTRKRVTGFTIDEIIGGGSGSKVVCCDDNEHSNPADTNS